VTFRSRLFATSLAAAALTLLVATVLVSWSLRRAMNERIERSLINEARLMAETLSHHSPASAEDLDGEADQLGALVAARVTIIGPDGTVVGDSELDGEALHGLENHGTRPEIVEAGRSRLGVARRYSTTLSVDMLYVAVPVRNPNLPLSPSFVSRCR
jgi:two-component system phosphate regulon sensor histidine kinase PhoR